MAIAACTDILVGPEVVQIVNLHESGSILYRQSPPVAKLTLLALTFTILIRHCSYDREFDNHGVVENTSQVFFIKTKYCFPNRNTACGRHE
ncbi:hypothetical protein Mapa_012581 [Marchantia paleacea]|nr:hypothetical protein Mapa_012581 [Marchantia paleacea]